MSSKLSQNDFAFKWIPYLPQDAGYKTKTHLSSKLMPSNLTQLNDHNEVQRVELLEIINDDLSNLLKMRYEDFIDHILRPDIQKYISTFLQFSRRSTDHMFSFNVKDKYEAISNQAGEGKIDMFGIDELSQCIRHKTFLVIHRLTDRNQISNKFSQESEYAQFLYDEWLFDIPRLMDFCAIYYFSNPVITQQIVSYIFMIQPNYNKDLSHAIDLTQQKVHEICTFYHSMDPDLKLSRKDKKPLKNTLEDLHRDMDLLKEILVNWYSLLCCYDHTVNICFEMDILRLMVILVECTFPVIQEQLNQFQSQRTFKKKDVNNISQQQYHPSIIISMRLTLLVTNTIITQQYKVLYDDMNGASIKDNAEDNCVEALQCKAKQLCSFLDDSANIAGFEELHIGARPFIEIGSFSRKLFGTFVELHKLIKYLLSRKIISLSDVGMISHLIEKIPKAVRDRHRNDFGKDEKEINDNIAKLLQIFPDHSAKYCAKLLEYFENKFDAAVNAVLEGSVPLSIEAVDDEDEEKNEVERSTKGKSKHKRRRKKKKDDIQHDEYAKFTGRAVKKDDDDVDDEEFFDMFGFDGNENTMKKFHKKVKHIYNVYEDDLDDSVMQYFGFGVDDGEDLSASDDIEYIENELKKEKEKEKEDAETLNTKLNQHSYKFIPHNNQPKQILKNNNSKAARGKKDPRHQQNKKQANKAPQSQDFRQNKPKYDNRRDNSRDNNRDDTQYNNQNDGRYHDNKRYNNNNAYDNRRYNRGYNNNNTNSNNNNNKGYNDNRGYDNRGYDNSSGYDGGRGQRGRGQRGRGRGSRGRGTGSNTNKYRQQKRNATNSYRRKQAYKKYSGGYQ